MRATLRSWSASKAGESIREEYASAACPICASGLPPERHELREMLYGTREVFTYLRCPACGALRIAEPPPDLGPYYPTDYYGDATGPIPAPPRYGHGIAALAGAARDRKALLNRGRRAEHALRRWAPPMDPEVRRLSLFTRKAGLHSYRDPILDVGCGRRATNLTDLRNVGFRRLLGIDPFIEADGEYGGVPLRKQTIHEVSGTYQAITFHHSFEHVPDPEATLIAAARRLRPGGIVLIRTPVMGGWFWEHFGRDWWELDPPRHLWVHTRSSLEQMATIAGLTLVDVVWDSTFVEVLASDQISRDIAWREPASWSVHPPAGYDDEKIREFRTLVAELNRSGRAGRAGFYFRKAPSTAGGAAS
jgi:SAM-dependent methyltransferase